MCHFVCPKSKKEKENCFKGKPSKAEIILETVDVFVSAVSIKRFWFLFKKILLSFSFVLFDFAFVMTVISLDIINW